MNTSNIHDIPMIDNPLRICNGNNLSKQQNKLKIMMMMQSSDSTLLMDYSTMSMNSACTMSSSSNAIATQQQEEQEQKHVRFGSLTIHEHSLVMGGAGLPSRSGPSISLSWKQDTCIELPSVIVYEESRPCVPRNGSEMLHTKNQRIDLLLGSGYTFREIRDCGMECDIIRKQRLQTVKKVQQRSSITRIGNKIRQTIFNSKEKRIMKRSSVVTNNNDERRKRSNTI
ncbi:hypothetical protein FRACYDRAFT_233081 [Fragilariopsis cylindrus CCMP1102]|uniref:Uncharacterized protein n=1 Tax=Fragilariopsis cylindrus CCMP1102 TaxID=635003 RepID=A0A1E7FXN4_9STRA|nr:hypothetical protein FRACYDRAFT_233081 [Fragilariopsis cylindrus CCMP1102]|eukprot:OEU22918.1 hypothetical protein FRACYDRAFT_233081 [Fragilariopsis cylindrus CCMP1102]